MFVSENDKLIGVITDRDIVIRAITKGQEFGMTKVRDVMTPKVLYCYEDDSIEDVAQNLANNQVRRMPVMNQDKRLVGVVSLGDICLNDKNCAAAAMEKICKRS
jgi:CBS domain-containing protein